MGVETRKRVLVELLVSHPQNATWLSILLLPLHAFIHVRFFIFGGGAQSRPCCTHVMCWMAWGIRFKAACILSGASSKADRHFWYTNILCRSCASMISGMRYRCGEKRKDTRVCWADDRADSNLRGVWAVKRNAFSAAKFSKHESIQTSCVYHCKRGVLLCECAKDCSAWWKHCWNEFYGRRNLEQGVSYMRFFPIGVIKLVNGRSEHSSVVVICDIQWLQEAN